MPKSIAEIQPTSIAEKQYFTIEETCKILPGRPHRNTVLRWMTRGYHGKILRSWRCGNRRVTTIPAIDEFMGAQDPSPVNSAGHLRAEVMLDEKLGAK